MLASLRAHPRPGVSSADAAQEKVRARELFDRVYKAIEHPDDTTSLANGIRGPPPSRTVAEDIEMHIEVARLWQNEDLDRTGKVLREALKISSTRGQPDPRLLNNLGVLEHLENRLTDARAKYEGALTNASNLDVDVAEAMSTSVLYNLARVYEDLGEETMATEAYETLLARHPEYVDGEYFAESLRVSLKLPLQPRFAKPRCWRISIVPMMLTSC